MRQNRDFFVVVGGSQSHVPFIQVAKDLGYRTVVFDRNPSAPGADIADVFYPISTHDVERILAECHYSSKQATLAGIITYSSYTMPLKVVAKVSEVLGLHSFSTQAVENTTNKARMKQRLSEVGVLTPEWLVTADCDEAVSFLVNCQSPVVVKPSSGSVGSAGISMVSEEKQLWGAFEAASKISEDDLVILEKFYNAREFSVDGIVSRNRGNVLAVSEKFNLGAAHNFVMSGFVTGQSPEMNLKRSTDAIARVVLRAVEALGINDSFFGADVLLTDQGPLVLEVGLLLDAKIDRLLHFCGVNVYEMICRVACGLDIEYEDRGWSRGYALKFMFADRPGLLSIGSKIALETLKTENERWIVEWERQGGDLVWPPESIADIISWVIVEANDRTSAWKRASEIASRNLFATCSEAAS